MEEEGGCRRSGECARGQRTAGEYAGKQEKSTRKQTNKSGADADAHLCGEWNKCLTDHERPLFHVRKRTNRDNGPFTLLFSRGATPTRRLFHIAYPSPEGSLLLLLLLLQWHTPRSGDGNFSRSAQAAKRPFFMRHRHSQRIVDVEGSR